MDKYKTLNNLTDERSKLENKIKEIATATLEMEEEIKKVESEIEKEKDRKINKGFPWI